MLIDSYGRADFWATFLANTFFGLIWIYVEIWIIFDDVWVSCSTMQFYSVLHKYISDSSLLQILLEGEWITMKYIYKRETIFWIQLNIQFILLYPELSHFIGEELIQLSTERWTRFLQNFVIDVPLSALDWTYDGTSNASAYNLLTWSHLMIFVIIYMFRQYPLRYPSHTLTFM